MSEIQKLLGAVQEQLRALQADGNPLLLTSLLQHPWLTEMSISCDIM